MIKINLLPLDKRKTERTPLKGAGLMIADAVVFGVMAILVIIHLIEIGNVNAEIKTNKDTLASLQPAVKEHDQLKLETEQLTREAEDLRKVVGARPFRWSEVIDAVWDAIHKHKRVWVDAIEQQDGKQMESKLKTTDPKTTITGVKHGLHLKCHVAGLDVKSMTAFRMELKENPRVARFFPHMNFDVQWNTMEQKEFAEKWSLDFEVMLINTGQTEGNTPAPATARSTP